MALAFFKNKVNYCRFLFRQYIYRKTVNTPPVSRISSEEFDNSGLCIINGKANHLKQKTIIVIGEERSGTSMVAGTLARLGIYMGNTLSPTVYEDHEVNHCLRLNDRTKMLGIIKERNQLYPIWGLKKPTTTLLKKRWQKMFREPVYIVIVRDVFAIANRRSVSRGLDLFSGMYSALNTYFKIVQFVHQTKRPTLIISYEKTLLNPGETVRGMVDFLGGQHENQLADAIAFIKPSPQAYLRVTTVHQGWRGMLESVSSAEVTGWGFKKQDKNPVNVILTLEDGTKFVTCANRSRCDVKQYYKNDSEYCGFQFLLPETHHIKIGETVSVHIEGEDHHLGNSPLVRSI